MSNCERAEVIILEAMEETKKHFMSAINSASNEKSRLDFTNRYASTLFLLADALGKISTERF